MRKTFTTAALAVTALASAAGSAAASPLPIPAGPTAFRSLTGLVLPAPDNTSGSTSEEGASVLDLKDTNVVNLMSDHSRTQVTGTTGVQG